MTGQIQRLHFYDSKSIKAARAATTRTMRRLRATGLVSSFERKIGGVRAGSASYVWHLTEGGMRFINLKDAFDEPRRRFIEPSYASKAILNGSSQEYIPTKAFPALTQNTVKVSSA